ncbi:hypothetical protein NDU88_000898 [Pleurodeles waltl]|uniref:Uncharacterized protein n=1 Tax=Pleurodeles waltl TaxID=8319 RepID=A0AAV7NDM1_PLEWA|nr:hypothetical protein NDU88_000898 [Pleurodeles waltl]
MSQRVCCSELLISPFIRRVRRLGAPGGQLRPIPDRGVLGLDSALEAQDAGSARSSKFSGPGAPAALRVFVVS